MKKIIKGFSAAIAAVILCTCIFAFGVSAADVGGSDFALDVVFVIDNSTSINDSDSEKISRAACKLFTDMCVYEEARVGYVFFSHRIQDGHKRELTPISDAATREMIKRELESIPYPDRSANEFTDIALGLEEATTMLSNSLGSGRRPVIILLGDGAAKLPNDSDMPEHQNRLKAVLDTLSGKDASGNVDLSRRIPVYTIALDADSSADDRYTPLAEEMEKISNYYGTDDLGRSHATHNASELPRILTEIMTDILRIEGAEPIVLDPSNGSVQEIPIMIPNNNILEAGAILLPTDGTLGVEVSKVLNPGGIDLLNSDSVDVIPDSRYVYVKILAPQKGNWKVTVSGIDEVVEVFLISKSDLSFSVKPNKDKANADDLAYNYKNGEAATFTVTCNEETDQEELANIIGNSVCTLEIYYVDPNAAGGVTLENTLTLSKNATSYSGTYQFQKAGTYKIGGTVTANDKSYVAQIREIFIDVSPYPLQLKKGADKQTKTLLSPLFGIDIMSSTEFSIKSAFASVDPSATFDVTPVSGSWEDICEVEYDKKSGNITVKAIGSGNETIKIKVVDSFGQEAEYTLRVNIIPSWLILIIIILVIALIVVLIIVIKKARMPRLGGTLNISATLPVELSNMAPPEAEIDMATLNRKGRVPLDALIASNLTVGGQYAQALSAISTFVHSIEFEAANADSSQVWIYVPASDKTATVQFNNSPVDKKIKQTISGNMPVSVSYNAFGGEYHFTFTLGGGNFGGDFTGGGDFGSTGFDSGFGGFGGGSGNGGFGGGFGGGSDNGGFGGGFGGGQNNGGFGGGFGGGSDNGGFGGGFGGGQNNGGFGGFGGGQNNGGFGGSDNGGGFGSF